MDKIEQLYLQLNAIDDKLSILKDKRKKELNKFEDNITIKIFNKHGDTNEAVNIRERVISAKKEELNEKYGINELRKEHSEILQKIEQVKKENIVKVNVNFMEA